MTLFTRPVFDACKVFSFESFLENEGDRYADKSTIASRAEKTRDANGTREEEMDSVRLLLRPLPSTPRFSR